MAAAAGVQPALLQLHPLPPLPISSSKRKTSRDLLLDIIKGYSHLTFMDKQFGEFERENKLEFLVYLLSSSRFLLQAKEAKVEISAEQITFDNRVRQYNSPDQKFNYFSSIQLVNKFGN